MKAPRTTDAGGFDVVVCEWPTQYSRTGCLDIVNESFEWVRPRGRTEKSRETLRFRGLMSLSLSYLQSMFKGHELLMYPLCDWSIGRISRL